MPVETLNHGVLEEFSEQVCGGDEEILSELIHDCLTDAENLIRGIQSATASGDPANLRLHSHSLKSTSRTFGGEALSDYCADVEHAAAEGRVACDCDHLLVLFSEFSKALRGVAGG